jgi:hypothetical protein
MDVPLSILKWVGISMAVVFLLSLLAGIISVIAREIGQIKRKPRAERMGSFLDRVAGIPTGVAKRLKPWQVFLIGFWYVLVLAGVVWIGYSLVSTSTEVQASQDVRNSPTALFLVQCFCCGCIGATVYGMLWISKSEEELQKQWRMRRYILLPLLGGFLGAVSFFFVKAGMLTVQAGTTSGQTAGANNGDTISGFAIYVVAFLSGFASRELTAKFIQVAETVFTKVPEPKIETLTTTESSQEAPASSQADTE